MSNINDSSIIPVVQWEVDKARVIVNDLQDAFQCADADNVSEHKMRKIKFRYREIVAKLAIISDVLDNIDMVIIPEQNDHTSCKAG